MRSQPPTVAKHRWPTPAKRPARHAWRLRCDGLETGSMPDEKHPLIDDRVDASAVDASLTDPAAMEQLEAFRCSIDEVDAALVRLLAERFRITRDVGVLKAAHGLPPTDLVRKHQQVAALRGLAEEAGLDPDFCEKFMHFVMDEVIRNHVRIAESAAHSTSDR